MFKIDKFKVYDKVAKQFFKVTESKPLQLIHWLRKYRDKKYPCKSEPYMKQFSLFETETTSTVRVCSPFYDSKLSIVHIPMDDLFNFWNYIRADKSRLKLFFEYLKGLKI